MTSFDSTLADLTQLETDLQTQISAVQEARQALTRVNGVSTSAPASAGSSPGPGRPPQTSQRRGRKGTRDQQAFEMIQKSPGITIPQIAKQMKIEPNYLYRVVPRLVSEGRVKKDGQGFVAVVS